MVDQRESLKWGTTIVRKQFYLPGDVIEFLQAGGANMTVKLIEMLRSHPEYEAYRKRQRELIDKMIRSSGSASSGRQAASVEESVHDDLFDELAKI